MEKLKKIISYIVLAIAFSLICIGIAHAETIENIGYSYWSEVPTRIETYKDLFDNVREALIESGRIEEKDILITPQAMNTSQPYDGNVNVCKINNNINLTRQNTGVYFSNCYTFSFDSNYNVTYSNSYYMTGLNLLFPRYVGLYYWFGGTEENEYTITNASSEYSYIINEENNTILGTNETMNLFDFVNGLNGNVSIYPTLEQPIIEQFNGYTRVTFKANNYTRDTIEDYNVMIENLTNATRYYMQPTIDGTTQASYVLDLYENTTISYYVIDLENEDILEDYFLSISVDYDINQNFKILINSIDNNIKKINYTYQANDNNTIENYTCFHQVMGGQEIQDNNCTYSGNNYNLILNGNENVTFKIYDNENNLIYQHNENFIFNLGDLYITFNENYINNFSNLEVRIHNYQNGYIVKYTINDSTQYTANLQDLSSYDNSKIFNINNLNKNSIIKIYVYDSNNNIIANSQYEINIYRNYDAWNTNFNINNIFNSLNIKNIASELLNYIKNIGNNLISSKIGNLILLEFFGSAIILILKLIRR